MRLEPSTEQPVKEPIPDVVELSGMTEARRFQMASASALAALILGSSAYFAWFLLWVGRSFGALWDGRLSGNYGLAVAALSVSGPSFRLGAGELLRNVVPKVTTSADRLSRDLGYAPG